eukprot:3519963-Rhodomonas_salina.1
MRATLPRSRRPRLLLRLAAALLSSAPSRARLGPMPYSPHPTSYSLHPGPGAATADRRRPIAGEVQGPKLGA